MLRCFGLGTGFGSRPVKGGACDYCRGCPDPTQVALRPFNPMGDVWAGGKGSRE